MHYQRIDPADAAAVARLAVCLTQEIIERTGVPHFDIDLPHTVALCERYLRDGRYTVVAAREGEQVLGFASACESCSLYAGGAFGIIQECYVLPAWRSRGIGDALIDALVSLARERHWTRLELCTPPLPAFDRTVAFYQANGFEITGGYKMKRLIG